MAFRSCVQRAHAPGIAGAGLAGRLHAIAALAALASMAFASIAAGQTAAPGGFLEQTTSTAVRSNAAPPLPARGPFTFPAPYNTTGVRLTNAGDCGGADCVDYIGYSYWRNMNNHVGSDTMLLFVTLDIARGGGGPTLFSYNKVTDQVTMVGPMFDASSQFAWFTGEGWYWSATQPTKLYINNQGPRLYRYDVMTKQMETVFDVTTQYPNTYLWQMHSSNDDKVHSATLRNNSTYEMLGCMAYREDTKTYFFAPKMGDFDECQIDKSGRWLLIKDNVDGAYGEDNRIYDLTTGAQTIFLDQQGAAGHSDNGYGYMVAEDNWNPLPGAVRVWTFGQPLPGTPPQGRLVYHTTDWSADIGHLSHANARPGVPLEQQFVCGANASRALLPRNNEVVCFRLDGSLQVLVVAPVMTNLDAAGGGDDYAKSPKGNLDVTGQYFIWTSNTGGSRLDAFIVKVPTQVLGVDTGGTPPPPPPPADTTKPTVSLTAPAAGATVKGTVTITASASDNAGVAGVQFKLNGANLGAEVTTPPFSMAWNTITSANGSAVITAVARDAAGNTATSASRTVTVSNSAASGGGAGVVKPIRWTAFVNSAASGGTLRKTGGCDGCQDSGASSIERITANGYMEFTASETTALRFVGLNPNNPDTKIGIRYAFALQPNGIAEVRESGIYRADTPFQTGDVLRIAVQNHVVTYLKNGVPIYQSTVPSTVQLLVDTALLSAGSTVTNVVVLGAP